MYMKTFSAYYKINSTTMAIIDFSVNENIL